MGLLSYKIQRTRTNDYLLSLFRLAKFLSMHAIDLQALDDFRFNITDFMRRCLDELKVSGEYDSLKAAAKQFRLTAQTFDVFGKSVESLLTLLTLYYSREQFHSYRHAFQERAYCGKVLFGKNLRWSHDARLKAVVQGY